MKRLQDYVDIELLDWRGNTAAVGKVHIEHMSTDGFTNSEAVHWPRGTFKTRTTITGFRLDVSPYGKLKGSLTYSCVVDPSNAITLDARCMKLQFT